MQGTNAIDAQVCALGDTQGVSNVGSMTNACASSSGGNDVASSSKKQRVSKGDLSQGKLAEAWQMQATQNATIAVRRFFYAEDIAHCKVRSPYFLDMVKAIGEVGPSYKPYKPPSYEALRVKELKDEDAEASDTDTNEDCSSSSSSDSEEEDIE
ncbi:hypothetical protein L7F22_056610 [Adiantum nelumboides]|nr:hypothetical protein [Adiantum nelumboides]